MKVELLDHMGSDLDVVNAARVSFDKQSEWFHGLPGNTAAELIEDPNCEPSSYLPAKLFLSGKDRKLIEYLAKHGHWTPFSHCYAKFRIKAPLFCRAQLFKHKVGLTENEVSRRYVDSEPEFYVPEVWRKRAENIKQGSSDDVVNDLQEPHPDVAGHVWSVDSFARLNNTEALCLYKALLDIGVCPEQARMVLPQSMYTEWIWSGSIAAFARVYQQRTSDHAQHETKQIALQIGEALEPLFPVSWKALCEHSQSHF